MSAKSPEVLTPEQRLLFTTIPDDLTTQEMARYYALSAEDIAFIRQHRGADNRLGVALQLCCLRFPGRMLMQMTTISERVVVYVAEQLHLSANAFAGYGSRRGTPYDHLQNICEQYGYRSCDKGDVMPLIRYSLPFALENDEALPLVDGAMAWMRQHKLIAPTILITEKLVWHIQRIARWRVYRRITNRLSAAQQETLQRLLVVATDKEGQTPLTWLRMTAPKPSVDGMDHLLERIAFINDLQLPARPDNVHPACFRQLAQRGQRYRPQPLANLENQRERYALLVAHLNEQHQVLIDQLVDMFDRWLSDLMRKGRNKQRHYLHRNITVLNRDLNTLAQAMAAFLEAKTKGIDPFEAVFAVVEEDVLTETVASATAYARPADMDFRDLVENTFSRRRKAMLDMMRSLTFEAIQETHSGLEALEYVLQLLDEHNQRVRSEEIVINGEVLTAPLEHLKRKRWKRHALTEDGINPNYYELAAFDRLQDGLRSGDISVVGSHRYQAFDDYLLLRQEWERLKKEEQTRLAVADDPQVYLQESQEQIADLLKQVAEVIAEEDSHLSLGDDGSLQLRRLEKATPPEAEAWRRQLYSYLPLVEMSHVMGDVNEWMGAFQFFPHLLTGEAPTGYHQAVLVAALMASGMNIGPTKMAQACDFSEQELMQSAEWHIREETLRQAIAELDNFVLHHPFSQHWGTGIASSSDGLRVPVVVNAPNAVYNARHFWYRRGITIVAHAADIWMPFYPQVMQDTSEALYVIDALCHHETDFDIQEHYTDTASATYHVFALCRMLGFRFAPRIRTITRKYLYTVEPLTVDKALQPLIQGTVDSALVVPNWDEMRRLTASIRHGTVSASLMMRKLASYPKQNQLALAFKEVGKLERTIFVLNYLLDPSLQRRNLRGLNKGEAIWSAAQAISHIGRDGEMYDRDFDAQLNRASSTMLLVAMVSAWNTVYLDKVVTTLRAKGEEIPDEYLAHVSPLGWQHINLLGRYDFDLTQAYPLHALRPLRKAVD